MLLIAATLSNPQGIPHRMHAHTDNLPAWIVIRGYVMMRLGTMFRGWRIVKTMGQKIKKLKSVVGFCAETGGAVTLFLATAMGVPVSTTHTITGAIVGVGAANRFSVVFFLGGGASGIVWAWILPITYSAITAAVAWHLGQFIF